MNGPNVTRGVILAVSCLVLGFVGGWSLANIGGKTIALPDARLDVTVAEPNPITTAAAGETVPEPVDPKSVPILVLNASGVEGQAAEVQGILAGKGYTAVAVGNAAGVTGNTVYYEDTVLEAATQVGTDLQITTVAPLAGTAIAGSAGDAKVVVVLGS